MASLGNILGHDYEDVSRHGSPKWQCRFCHCYDYQDEAGEPCLMAEACLAKEAIEIEEDERVEYEFMKKERERWDYLSRKYGGFKGEK